MRQFDLAPLYRNTVGFDRLFSMLDQLVSVDSAPTYPPYNIERTGRTRTAFRSRSPASPIRISRSR